ncbi:MAG: helix-turn-helix transcriptional regulator [Bacteroidota bacterium]
MDDAKRKKLEAAGFQVGTAAEFLDLTDAEAALVESRLALADAIRSTREASGLSQADLAKRVRSSQSRISKAEQGDPSISTDLMLRFLYGAGARPETVLSERVLRRTGLSTTSARQKEAA